MSKLKLLNYKFFKMKQTWVVCKKEGMIMLIIPKAPLCIFMSLNTSIFR